MQQYLKIVGNGQRTARDLSYEEAKAACTLIMEGQASLPQVTAFMAVLRVKEESAVELTAFTRVARLYSQQLETVSPHSLDICVPYDGRSKTPMLIVPGAIIAATCGAFIAMHGRLGQTTPPKFGVGVGDVLAQLGVPVNLPLQQAGEMLNQTGLAFCASAHFAPRLEQFNQIRLDYGMRSFLNTVEKLLNPFAARNALVGIFHYPVMRRVSEATSQLGYSRTLSVQGSEGSAEVLPNRHTPVMEYTSTSGQITEWKVDPHEYGWWESVPAEMSPVTTLEQAKLTAQILDPSADVPAYYRHGAALTAALMLVGAGVVPTLADGLAKAQTALTSGDAGQRLKMMREDKYHA